MKLEMSKQPVLSIDVGELEHVTSHSPPVTWILRVGYVSGVVREGFASFTRRNIAPGPGNFLFLEAVRCRQSFLVRGTSKAGS